MNNIKIPPIFMSGKKYFYNESGVHVMHDLSKTTTVDKIKNIELPKQKKKISKIFSYFKFEFSNFYKGKVSKRIFNDRKNKCLDCHGLMKDTTDPIGYCGLCGCGKNPRARLTVKLTVAGATCPLNKWQPVKRGKLSFGNLVDSSLGICQTLWYNAKQLWQRN
jgi:hypothetical protein